MTAGDLSSQEAELQPPLQLCHLQQEQDMAVENAALQQDMDIVMKQMISDMQDRIIDVAICVAGRLVKRSTPNNNLALLLALGKDDVRREHLRQWLTHAGCSDELEDFAAHFDKLYHDRHGELCMGVHP